MVMRKILIGCSVGSGCFLLQGCGGGPTNAPTASPTPMPTSPPSPAPPAKPTPMPTPSPTEPKRPMSEEEAAKYYNSQWLGFDEIDGNSPLGVTLSMGSDPRSFFHNIFCKEYKNPVLDKPTGCHAGGADCRLSAALVNHKVGVDEKTGAMTPAMGRTTGYIFSPAAVLKYAKCSYIWDGATQNKINNGCGIGGTADCAKQDSGYSNLCDGKICTADSARVKEGLCEGFGGKRAMPPVHGGQFICAIPSTTIDYHGQADADYKPRDNNLREMLTHRIKFNNGTDPDDKKANIEMWNEVVLDERLLTRGLTDDPVSIVDAFVYVKGNLAAKSDVTKMRDEFVKVLHIKGEIPILAMDTSPASVHGPFSPLEKEELVV